MALQFIKIEDILTRIKEDDLDVIIGNDVNLLDEPEADAINEVSSYISGRYDVKQIFSPDEKPDATIKRMVIDLLIYNLHTRINPRNIPEKRIQLRDDAIEWLKLVASVRSNVTADFLPLREFDKNDGLSMSWGSKTKRKNDY